MANKWFTATALAVGMVAVPAAASAETQIRVFGGLNMTEDLDTTYYGYDAQFEVDEGYVIGAGFGITNGNWLFEGEISHRDADISEVQFLTYYAYDFEGSVSATAGLINAWYNFDTGSAWGFYAGGGIGIADAEFESGGYSYSETELAWQLGAGASYRTESGFAYGFGYRYFNIDEVGDTNTSVTSHDFIFEVSRRF